MKTDDSNLIESLTECFNSEMEEMGNKDYTISNIKLCYAQGHYAFANVSYVWHLNSWDKRVNLTDMIFVLCETENGDGVWKSPLFYSK